MQLAIFLFTAALGVAPAEAPKAYVLITPNESVTHGSFDLDAINAIREAYGPNLFWFRCAGKDYLIRDEKVVAEISDLFRPQRELGRQQADLGAKQAALGAKQSALGTRQAQLGAEQAQASSYRQAELSRRQDELSRQQEELGRQQSALGDEQSQLGEKQGALSRQIEKRLAALIEEWIRGGIAQPLHR